MMHIKTLVQHLACSSVLAIISIAMMLMLMQLSCEEAELLCLQQEMLAEKNPCFSFAI